MFEWKNKTDLQIAKEVIRNQGRLESIRCIHDPLREEIVKIYTPYDWCLKNYDPKVLQYNPKVFSDTPADSKNKFVDGVTAYTISRRPWWLRFSTAVVELMKNDEVKKYLQKIEEQTKFGYAESNFYSSFPQIIEDAATIGPGIALPEVDEKNGRVVFRTFKHWNCWIDDDEWGNIDVFHRRLDMSAKNLLSKFGEDKLPEEIVQSAKGEMNKDPFKTFSLLHAIYYNGNRAPGGLDSLDQPYISFYVMPQAPGTGKEIPLLLEKKGRKWFIIDLRTNRKYDQVYNTTRTLATRALISSGVVSALGRDMIKASAMAVNPPTIAPVGLRDQGISIRPGGRMWYDKTPGQGEQKLETLMDKLNWNMAEAQSRKMEDAVIDKFYVRLFETWARVEDMSQMTIFQVGQVSGEKAVLLGTVIEAIEEMLDKTTQVVWDYEASQGRFPPENEIPDVLKEARNQKIVNEYDGHLSRMKRTMNENRDTANGLAASKAVTDMYPDSKEIVNARALHERVGIAGGLKQDDFFSDEQMKEIDERAAELEQQAQAVEMIERAASAAPGLSKPIEEGSPLELAGVTAG